MVRTKYNGYYSPILEMQGLINLHTYKANIKLPNDNNLKSDAALVIKDCWCLLLHNRICARLYVWYARLFLGRVQINLIQTLT